jgi:hypothetical protein
MKLHSINAEQKLYVMHEGEGYSCYGFDVLDRRARAVAAWSKIIPPLADLGTVGHFEQCSQIMEYGAKYAVKKGTRCEAELIPQFVGLEGKRVEITMPNGGRKRFCVGKSTGWLPCHLEIMTSRSHGGSAAYFPEGATVRVIR